MKLLQDITADIARKHHEHLQDTLVRLHMAGYYIIELRHYPLKMVGSSWLHKTDAVVASIFSGEIQHVPIEFTIELTTDKEETDGTADTNTESTGHRGSTTEGQEKEEG